MDTPTAVLFALGGAAWLVFVVQVLAQLRAAREASRRMRAALDAAQAPAQGLEHADERCGGTWLLCFAGLGEPDHLECASCGAAAPAWPDLIAAAAAENEAGRVLRRLGGPAHADTDPERAA